MIPSNHKHHNVETRQGWNNAKNPYSCDRNKNRDFKTFRWNSRASCQSTNIIIEVVMGSKQPRKKKHYDEDTFIVTGSA